MQSPMDKRRLYRDIAIMRQRIFAVTAVIGFAVVLAGTIIGNGMDFNLAFRNSVLALMGFGLLGYLWGMYYEKVAEPALVESYRTEAQKRMDELKADPNKRFILEMSVDELQPNMISVNAVTNSDGALLVREGAKLTERMIQNLKDNGVRAIKVEAQHRQMADEEYE
ncbi:MAG: hypothetical protein GC154_01250 [bacterium]|nr:hypothetical protein [bacterium]